MILYQAVTIKNYIFTVTVSQSAVYKLGISILCCVLLFYVWIFETEISYAAF